MLKTIYTVNLNSYDSFKEPTIITPGWDYVYYTNDKSIKSKVWKVIYIDASDPKEARKLKILNPFNNHDISIWHDSSMLINCNLDQFVKHYCKADLNLMTHLHRNCIYEEAKACIQRKKDDPDIINQQIDRYLKMNYPKNSGMVATGILVRKKSNKVNHFCQEWWNEVKVFSKRDQLSFNFVEYFNPIEFHLFPFEVLKKEFVLQKHLVK